MGVETIITAAAIGTTVYSTMKQQEAQDEAKKAAQQSAEEQRKARAEQDAQNAAQAAQERRQQIREANVKRARLIQSGINSGDAYSSGVAGAEGNIATQISSNLGINQGSLMHANNISAFNQNAADFMSSAQSHINEAQKWGGIGSLGMSIFGHSGGFGSLFGKGTQSPANVINRDTLYTGQ